MGWPEMPVAGPKGSFEGTGTPRGSNVKQGEIGKPKSVLGSPNPPPPPPPEFPSAVTRQTI